jgi:hypothetical protein
MTATKAVPPAESSSSKFTPLDLERFFNASSTDIGPCEYWKGPGATQDGLLRLLGGQQAIHGIPFRLGPGGTQEKSCVVMCGRSTPNAVRSVEIPLPSRTRYVCLAAFADVDKNEHPPAGEEVIEKAGQHLADAVLVYEDGSERVLPLRRRFEVDSPAITHLSFSARMLAGQFVPAKLLDPIPGGRSLHLWGLQQYGLVSAPAPVGPDGAPVANVFVCSLPNPEPTRDPKILRLQGAGDDRLMVCGVTAFHGAEDPLRRERLQCYRVTLPEPAGEDKKRWKVDVDLGQVARVYVLPDFDSRAWLLNLRRGLGDKDQPIKDAPHLYIDMTAHREAIVSLQDAKLGKRYQFDLAQLVAGEELEARESTARLEVLESSKVWLHGQVVDAAAAQPTPVRLAFRSPDGRYLPPYGHRTEINSGWFQDYGADVKLWGSSFAYVDGQFQVELPVGEVYLEMTKGFEYEPIRQKLEIKPGQRELRLEIPRFLDLRSKGWVTADVHVHFLSPTTAVLEGQAEGLNLINLLAAQWGDMFSNVGDLRDVPLTARDGETMVRMGTENRQHMLGHINLLGGRGNPVYPLSASGPKESYFGDPVWSSLAGWADACRQQEGVVIMPHFTLPNVEVAADIVTGRVDAVELIATHGDTFNIFNYREWYHYLNCGYRVTAAGGTDKMGAYAAVGGNRRYAYLGPDEFTFANWGKAVRSGNTFVTSGPLLLFRADERVPGEEITLGAGGGTVEVEVDAQCFIPFHRLEVVMNGRVVASREVQEGTRKLVLKEKVRVPGPAWLAARCYSNLDPTPAGGDPIGGYSIAAHTSPVYVKIPGQELFSAPIATYFLTLVDGADAWLDKLAVQPDPERFEQVRRVFREARVHLHRRLHAQAAKR